MVHKLISKGKKILVDPQQTVLSAATIIMFMILASRVLGLVRQRVLAHFFTPEELSLFFAAFRLPDLVFEILVFGTFSSAFIPVFSKKLKEGNHSAWDMASYIVNIGLVIFIALALILSLTADKFYQIIAPGYGLSEQAVISYLTKILFAAQGFFVVSYVLTGVLESSRRFFIPALAPLFYNLGIIIATVFFSKRLGLYAPTLGVVLGALSHFLIQLPLSVKLGFRFKLAIKINEDIKKIGRLAYPRLIEVSFLQISKSAELFFASLISVASYTYYTFGNTLQLLPIGLFGLPIAKAVLPTLSRQSEDIPTFKKTLISALYQCAFLTIPLSVFFIVLRVPLIRLVYGTDIFDWTATVTTGYVLSAFSVGIFFQAANSIVARGFYALHDTKTPVLISLTAIFITVVADFIFIKVLQLDIWALASAFTLGSFIQFLLLLLIIKNRIKGFPEKFLNPFVKIIFTSAFSGLFMYMILKVFDRSVWVKRLSFFGKFDFSQNVDFEKFVLDTRYTFNLLILTAIVLIVGVVLYIAISLCLDSKEAKAFLSILKRILIRRKPAPIPDKEQESVVPTTEDTSLG
ncbi:murein biosynthesis integral membrane protein MurJ [Candidatus Woesebacteria bacterium RBG_13_34_9]|uniref:Probable lipid II flippase MurJ n=1 Tax=Candidatus Woesebacteria bacterium RBG_13_34_9 TaxID=1802477 RepID=A0A1F7X375_9BACT|nr:MAG: murein biosynthesis integral membrane protein MurJ [Candidatus Woesebacteria bacterium RBG_13_34_9]